MTDTLNRPIPTREERAALRLAQYRFRRLVGWIVLAGVLVFGGAGVYVVWGTSVLGFTTAAVTSTQGEPAPGLATAVQQAVDIPIGTPLISIDLQAVERRVEAVPAVADASVSRHWPDTIRVSVTPRVPVAVVAANSARYLLDASGLPYQTVASKPADLVSLRLATPGPGDPATMAGLEVIQSFPAKLVAVTITVTARSAYDISIELTDGRTVFWGGAADSARKAQILPAVLTQPGTHFDLSDPGLVTVR